MATAIETLNAALVGRKIAGLDARELGDGAELAAVTLDDGTKLTFDWNAGTTHDRVGLRVERRPRLHRA